MANVEKSPGRSIFAIHPPQRRLDKSILVIISILLIGGALASAEKPAGDLTTGYNLPFIKTQGKDIVNGEGEMIFLQGTNFGAWLQWEGTVLGLPGLPEDRLRRKLAEEIGEDKVNLFFDLIRDNFITAEDFKNAKSLQFNFIRLPFDHHFVKEDRRTILDEAIEWASDQGIYVLLAMYATSEIHDIECQEEFIHLWEILAERYKNDPTIAGYELLGNCSDLDDRQLADLYGRTISRIRKIDPRHMIFLCGNHYSQFGAWERLLDDNLVYVFQISRSIRKAKKKTRDYWTFHDKHQVPIILYVQADPDIGARELYHLKNSKLNWVFSSYKQASNSVKDPFYHLPSDHPWKQWLDNSTSKNTVLNIVLFIEQSQLSSACKKEAMELFDGNQSRRSLAGLFGELSDRYPSETRELKRILRDWQERRAHLDAILPMSEADFISSFKKLSDSEIIELAESVSSKYWKKGKEFKPREREPMPDGVRMVGRLMGKGKTETKSGKTWNGDLGVMFSHNQEIYLLAGDTDVAGKGLIPNAMAITTDRDASNGLELHWITDPDGTPRIFFKKVSAGSTVPAGAISLNGIIYLFMMDVTTWGNDKDPHAHARSILIKSTDGGETFSALWMGEVDDKFVNISPVVATHPLDPGKEALFMIASGFYRNSPIYLAFTEIDKVEDKTSYRYFVGLKNSVSQWSHNQQDAKPIIRDVIVGELSVQWNDYLNQWLLAYFNWGSGEDNLYFRAGRHPWGPWSEERFVMGGGIKYDWYQKRETRTGFEDWGSPYGGYLLHDLDRENGRLVYFTLSLWRPYSIFLLEADLSKLFNDNRN